MLAKVRSQNAVEAEHRFDRRRIRLSGQIDQISVVEFVGTSYAVRLRSRGATESIACWFQDSEAVRPLRKGQRITVEGRTSTYDNFPYGRGLSLRDCSVVGR